MVTGTQAGVWWGGRGRRRTQVGPLLSSPVEPGTNSRQHRTVARWLQYNIRVTLSQDRRWWNKTLVMTRWWLSSWYLSDICWWYYLDKKGTSCGHCYTEWREPCCVVMVQYNPSSQLSLLFKIPTPAVLEVSHRVWLQPNLRDNLWVVLILTLATINLNNVDWSCSLDRITIRSAFLKDDNNVNSLSFRCLLCTKS